MVKYNDYDVFYDYEVLQNVTTNAMLFPGSRQIVIPYNVHLDSVQPNVPQLTVNQEDENQMLAYIIEQNRSSLKRWNIPEENVRMTPHFMQEIQKLDTLIPQNRGTMFGFNSSGYDVAITAYLLDQARQDRYSNVKKDNIVTDAAMVREFSDYLINHTKRSPWASVRDRANETRNFELFQKFAALMNSPWNIDVQSLNAKMSKTALKRLAAQGGFKVETSQKLKDGKSVLESNEELAELLAYNVNDIFATLWLFEQKAYQTPYNQRITLIERYGDNQFKGKNIKRDSTEAKLIENVISPNDSLVDDDTLTLAYPVTRDYMPQSAIDPEFTLDDANALHGALKKATRSMKEFKAVYKENENRAMNQFLLSQYQEKVESDPEHLIVKHFFYPTGHPRMISQNGAFVYDADTFVGFNRYMTDMLDYWANAYGMKLDYYAKGKQLALTSLQKAKTDKVVSDKNWDTFANYIIEHVGKTHDEGNSSPLYDWLYHPSGKLKVVAKDKELMVDLLNYVDENYELHPDVYQYYDAFRGEDMGRQDGSAEVKAKLPSNMRTGAAVLVTPDTPVFATMSIGGVHGNLIDLYGYTQDKAVADEYNNKREQIIDFYTEKAAQFSAEKYLEITGESSDNEREKIFALAGLSAEELAPVLARRTKRNGFVLGEPDDMRAMTPSEVTTGTYSKAKFKKPISTKALKTYTTTLYETDVVHMDISSYYPTLISILKTLQTKSGRDLYDELRVERVNLKNNLPHDFATWTDEDHHNQAIQLANKLLLNAASGAADAGYDNNIRVNNKAYRMRIAGQLILFALCLDVTTVGGIPNSINTDGVFVHNIDVDVADGLIQKWASLFALEADTEMVDLFISKDSNNRIEYYKTKNGENIVASGGTVGNWEGTTLTGNLNRPPISDRALTQYLIRYDDPLMDFDRDYIRNFIVDFIDERVQKGQSDPKAHEELFNYFQMPLVSNESNKRYVVYKDADGNWTYPSSINRVFLTKEDTDDHYETLQATMLVINKTIKKDNPKAIEVAYETDVMSMTDYEDDKAVHAGNAKISNVEIDQHFVIQNQSTATIDWKLTEYFDIEAYVDIVHNLWKNWAV